MSTYTLYAQYVDGELINVSVVSNNPIVVYSLQAPGTGTLRLRDLRDVDDTTPSNGNVLGYNTGTGTWGPVALAGGGDMLAATYDSDANSAIDLEAGGLNADVSTWDGLLKVASGTASALKYNFAGTVAPTTGDDSGDGYAVGSVWLDTTADKAYICLDATVAAAVWKEVTVLGAPTGTANTVAYYNAGGNLVSSDMTFNGVQLQVGSGNSVWIKDQADGGFLLVGQGVSNGLIVFHLLGTPDKSVLWGVSSRLDLVGSDGITLKPTAASPEFVFPTADGSAGHVMKTNGSGTLSLGAVAASEVTVTPFSTVTSSTVQTALEEIYADLVIESGFANRTDSVLSFVDGTRTFTVAPTGASFTIWVQGEKYVKSTPQSIVISNTEGIHYIYFNASGVLTETTTFTSSLIADFTLVAFVYWDATNLTAILFGDERHGRTMDSSTHSYLHNIFSTQYDSGLALGSILADESGNLATHIQCSVSNGVIRDEDIRIEITDGSPQDLDPIAQIPILYRSGAAGDWRKIAATGYLVTTAGTGRAAWNEFTGGAWQLTETTNNDFVLVHVFATNDINTPIIIVAGQAEYPILADAQAAALTEITDLASGPLDDAFPEWKAIGTIIVQTSNSYGNAVKSRIVTTAEGDDYIDFRTTPISPNGGVTVQVASETVSGIVELAIASEINTGTDATRAVTPDSLAGSIMGTKSTSIMCFGPTADVSTGDGKAYLTIPSSLFGMNLVLVHARVITAGTTGTTDIQIHNVTQAADMLTTKITIDSGETGSNTAATPAVIDTGNDDVTTYDLLRIDVDAVSTTAPKGLIVTLEFRLP